MVISWIKALFPFYRKEMKGINWGLLYNQYHEKNFSTKEMEDKVSALMADEEITKKAGIYYYVFDGKENHLNLRSFLDRDKRTVYEKQKGICPLCGKHFEISEMEGDHIIPWSKGGKTVLENLQMLCVECNLNKTNRG